MPKMRTAFLSLGSLLVISTLLGSSALALFLPEGRFTGMVYKTSSPELLVRGRGNTSPLFKPEDTLTGSMRLQPGMSERFEENFWVRNNSAAEDLTVQAQLEPGDQDWEVLKKLVQLKIRDEKMDQETEWYTLEQWVAAPKELPNAFLEAQQEREYRLHYEFADTYPFDPDGDGPLLAGDPIGNEMMNKQTANVKLHIKGSTIHI